MFKWLRDHALVISIGLLIIISNLLFPSLSYLTGILVFGYFLAWVGYRVGHNRWGMDQEVRGHQPENISEGDIVVSDKTNTKQAIDGLDDKNTEKPLESIGEMHDSLFVSFGSFWDGLFPPLRHKPKPRSLSDKLVEAVSRCKEEAQIQNAEEREINKAIEAFTQEADHYIKVGESKIKQFASQHGCFQLATENTESRLSSGRNNRNPLWAELRELRKIPLKCTYDVNNPCLESIELYIEARKERHHKIMKYSTCFITWVIHFVE